MGLYSGKINEDDGAILIGLFNDNGLTSFKGFLSIHFLADKEGYLNALTIMSGDFHDISRVLEFPRLAILRLMSDENEFDKMRRMKTLELLSIPIGLFVFLILLFLLIFIIETI